MMIRGHPGSSAMSPITVVKAAWLLPASGSCLQSRQRGYYRHLGLVWSALKAGVTITCIWVLCVSQVCVNAGRHVANRFSTKTPFRVST